MPARRAAETLSCGLGGSSACTLHRPKVFIRASAGKTCAGVCVGLFLRILLQVTLCLLVGGCSAIAPAPCYTSVPQRRVVAELVRRRNAGERRLLRVVERYLGIPYRWGGTSREGMDCSAFVRAVFRETYGIELPRTSRQMYSVGRAVQQLSELQAGDLVFFRDASLSRSISHVGIYIGEGRFAHSSAADGSAIGQLSARYFEQRYAGARRLQR